MRCKVLQDAHFCIHIALHLIVIAVEVVGCDIEQHGDVRFKLEHIFKLEAAQFDDIPIVCAFGHLQSQASSDVSTQSYVVSSRFKDVVDERSCCCFAVATRDAHHLCVGVTGGELNLTHHANAVVHRLLHHRRLAWDARALNDFFSIEDFFLGMLPFFPGNAVSV